MYKRQVKVEDIHGNTVTSGTGSDASITLAIGAGPGFTGLSCTSANPLVATAGVATFAGCNIGGTSGTNYKLSAAAISFGTVNSTAFTVTFGTATKFAFTTSPNGGAAGATWTTQPVVTVEDTWGNTVTSGTNSNASITLAINSGPGVSGFSCTTTFPLAATSGIASFTGCKIGGLVGTYTLKATGPLTTGTSGNVPITVPGPASVLVFTTQPSGATAGAVWTNEPAVSVQDGFGNTVTTATGSVTMSILAGGPQGTFTSGTASVPVSSGVAAFTNLVVNTAGSYTLTATPVSIAGTSPINSVAFTVNPAGENKLAITAPPTGTITAGGTVSVGITVEDAFNNTITTGTGSTDTISVALNSGSFAAGTTSVAAANGIANFSGLQINTAGTYTITASDTTNGTVTNANTNQIIVTPSTANKLAFTTQPSGATAGSTWTNEPVVKVEDTYNNVVSSQNAGSVTMSIATGSPQGTFSSGTASINVVNGVATFTNLVVNTAGSYTLTASPVSITGVISAVNSNPFTVLAASANKLVLISQPSDTAVGTIMSPAVTVQVQDQYNNLKTTDSATSITLTPSTGSIDAGGTLTDTNGVATFNGIQINTANAGLTLNATANGLTSAGPSSSFTIYVPVNSLANALTDLPNDGTGSGVASIAYYYCSGYSGPCTGTTGWTQIGNPATTSPWSVAWSTLPTSGAYRVVAVGIDNVNNTSAPSGSIPVKVTSQQSQTITFTSGPPTPPVYVTSTYTPTATATPSNLTVALTIDASSASVCSIGGANLVTFNTAGTCTIDANQAGNATYSAAPQVQQSIVVSAQTVPGAPTVGTVTTSGSFLCGIGVCSATVNFTPPASNGGSPITGYTATCTSQNGGVNPTSNTGTSSPITVPPTFGPTWLTNNKLYTCSVTATNAIGTGPPGTSAQFTS